MSGRLFLVGIVGFALGVAGYSVIPLPFAFVLFVLLLSLLVLGAWMYSRRTAYLFIAIALLACALGSARTVLVPATAPQSLHRS